MIAGRHDLPPEKMAAELDEVERIYLLHLFWSGKEPPVNIGPIEAAKVVLHYREIVDGCFSLTDYGRRVARHAAIVSLSS